VHKALYKRLISQSITQPPAALLNFILRSSQVASCSSEEKSKSKIQDPSTVTVLGMRWEKELPDSSEGPKRLSAVESKELLRCEELLPLQALIAYRQQAVTETLLRAYERSLKAAESTHSATGPGGGKAAAGGIGGAATGGGVGVTGGSAMDATTMDSTAHDGLNSPQKKKKTVASALKNLFRNKAEKEKKKDEGGELHEVNEESTGARSVDDEGIGTQISSGRDYSGGERIDAQTHSKGNSSPFLKMRSMSSLFRSHKDLKLDIDPVTAPAAAALAPSSPSPSMSRVEAMDDVSLEYLTSELLEGVTNSISNKRADAEGESFFPLRLQLSASVSVILSDVMPLVMVQVACGGDVTVKSMTDLRVDCYVQEVRIEDLVTVTPVRRTLLSFAHATPAHAHASASAVSSSVSLAAAAAVTDKSVYTATPTPQIRVLYVSSGLTSSSLRATCQPIEVAINVLCVERLSELVAARAARLLKVVATFGENDYLRKTAEWGAEGVITAQTGSNMAGQVAEAIVGDGMEICVEVQSNKVYLPHCSSRDEGCFVLDLGRAGLTGSYSVDNGLSLRLEVTDLCAGIIPPLPLPLTPPLTDSSAGAHTGIEYLLHPVDAHLTFVTPPLEKEKDKESILAFKSFSSSASSSAPALHRSSEYLEPDNALPCTDSRLESKLLIDLKLQSGLQIILTPPKLVQIVKYSRIFISFVWTVNNVFCIHLGESTKGIAEEKLAEGLHYLNSVLNPTMKSSQSRNNSGSSNNNSNNNSNSNSNSNSKGKAVAGRIGTNLTANKNKSSIKSKGAGKGKGKGKVSAMFSKIVQNLSGAGTGTGVGTGVAVRAGKGTLFSPGVRGGAGAEATRAGECLLVDSFVIYHDG
jgi:hypothetical protein